MKKIAILFAALAALVSCNKENPVTPETPSQETYSVTLTAVAPTAGDDTKTTLVEGGKFVHWSKGDAIKVLFFAHQGDPTVNDDYYYTGRPWTSEGQVFSSYFNEETVSEAMFRIENWAWTKNDLCYKDLGVAIYPASATAVSKKTEDSSLDYNCNTEISFDLPVEQVAVEGNIQSNLNFSYARLDHHSFRKVIAGEESMDLQFKNACALIKVTMPQSFGDKKVTSVTIESKDKMALAGYGRVKTSTSTSKINQDIIGSNFTVSVGEGDELGVTLSCQDGFNPGASYYAVVWPGEHSGLTFTFTADDESSATIETQSAVNLQASHIKPYTFKSALEFEETESYVYYAPGDGTGKYYYSNGTVGDNPAPTDRTILGVVFYNGNPCNNDTALPAHCTHGLAIRVKNKSGVQWSLTSPLPNADFANHSKLYNVGEDWGYSVKIGWENTYPGLDLNLYSTDYSIDSCDLPDGKTSGWYHATGKEWEIIKNDKDNINANLALCNGDATYQTNVKVWYPIMYNRSGYWKAYYFYDSGLWGIIEDKQNINNASINARPIFAF